VRLQRPASVPTPRQAAVARSRHAQRATGQLRLDTGGGCLPSEQAVQWNQTGPPGPPGPPGNTDSIVRHISGFMFDGTTVTTPLLRSEGESALADDPVRAAYKRAPPRA